MQRQINRLVASVIGLLSLIPLCNAQSLDRGALLVATDALADTTFSETVLLVIHHDNEGSIAIMVNRPTNLSPSEAFSELASIDSYDGVLFFGGPVAPARAFILTRLTQAPEASAVNIVDDIYLSGDFEALEILEPDTVNSTSARIYAGHSQWGPNQLEAEIASGAWIITNSDADAIFSEDPKKLWQQVLQANSQEQMVRSNP